MVPKQLRHNEPGCQHSTQCTSVHWCCIDERCFDWRFWV